MAVLGTALFLLIGPGDARAEPVQTSDGWFLDASIALGPVTPSSFIVLPAVWASEGSCARSLSQGLSLLSVAGLEGTLEPVEYLPGLVALHPSEPLPLGTVSFRLTASNGAGSCDSPQPDIDVELQVVVQAEVTPAVPTVTSTSDEALCNGSGQREFALSFSVTNPLFKYEPPSPNPDGVEVSHIGGVLVVAKRPHSGVDEASCVPVIARNMVTDATTGHALCALPAQYISKTECDDCQGGNGTPLWALFLSLSCWVTLRRRSGRLSTR